MMFPKSAVLLAAAFLSASVGAQSVQCKSGTVQCCEELYDVNSLEAGLLGSILRVNLTGILGQIGSRCGPLGLLSGGAHSCNTNPVCCDDNKFNGLLNIGCNPLDVL